MNREQANIIGKQIYDEWRKKCEQIEKEAKEGGKWIKGGLDSNNYLFDEINAEAKAKLGALAAQITDD